MNKLLGNVSLVFALLVGAAPLLADIDVYAFSDDSNRALYQSLTKELRCPKCQNQDIADSNAPIAKDMRFQVHRLVEEGKGHEDVVAFMIDRFGEFVTYKPPVRAETYLLWYGPVGFLVLAVLVIIARASRKRSVAKEDKGNSLGSTEKSPDYKQVEDLINKYGDD